MAQTIIREVHPGVWIFSRPFARYGIFPLGGRSTAIKLQSGGVWVLASTLLDQPTRAKLNELGEVKYIMGADAVHWLFLADFKAAFPSAKVIGPEPLIGKLKGKLEFDGAYGRDPPETKYGFEDEISVCYATGHRSKELAFFHHESKSLIEADLLFNLPGREQYSQSSFLGRQGWFNTMSPGKSFHTSTMNKIIVDKEAMKRDIKTIAAWDFERIIPCHGDVIEKVGKKAWRDTYPSFLD